VTRIEQQALALVLSGALEQWASHTSRRELRAACDVVARLLQRLKEQGR
jgi:hypothetical protein